MARKASSTRNRAASLPEKYDPSLPTLVKSAPEGSQWVHEVKYDGYRIGCRIDRGKVSLLTRNENDWTDVFPEIADAAKALESHRCFIDGEACVVLDDGRTSFQALQGALKQKPPRNLLYFVFDLIYLDGREVSAQPLSERKRALRDLIDGLPENSRAVIRMPDHFEGNGPEVMREACKLGLEGIVSKRIDMPYLHGRNRTWAKIKCVRQQEFVIGGFTDPQGSRTGIGALLAGIYEGDRLRFAGKVGTGFDADTLIDLRNRLNRIEQKECPFTPRPPGALGHRAHWVQPELVAEVEFSEWTKDGKIRHSSYRGLREDKPAKEVRREEPAAALNAL